MLKRAFTLIELLIVITITVILLALIIIPVFQSFNMTRQAQALAEAQELARRLSDRISVEIGNSIGVRDNSGAKGTVNVQVPGQGGADTLVSLPYSKLDIVLPAQGDPERGPTGALIDPETGKEDPTLRSPKGQVVLPVGPGNKIVRYFIGLRDPFQPYNNPYDGILMARAGGRDNLYVLYRAEVDPYVWDPDANGGARFVINQRLFLDLGRIQGSTQSGPYLDDPNFFIPTEPNPIYDSYEPGDLSKEEMVRNWIKESEIVTEISRFDMIQPLFNKNTRQPIYDGIKPRLIPLVQFRPTRISSESAEGQLAIRLGEEAEGSADIAPDVYDTLYGLWANPVVRTYPSNWNRNDPNLNELLIGSTAPTAGMAGVAPGFHIKVFDPDTDVNELTDGTEVFDVYKYETGVASGVAEEFPFTAAITSADSRSGWLSDQKLRDLFTPYYPDPSTGKLIASFGIDEVGTNGPSALPSAITGLSESPLQDPNWATDVYSGTGYEINGAFNRVWNDPATQSLRPNIHRFIDLRVTGTGDGTPSPLHPDPMVGFSRARIVPGSEEVTGPDQIPGPNYGQTIIYTRTTHEPGPNQYRINYVDQPIPEDWSLAYPGFGPPPATYTPTDFMSAVIEPRYKAGYIQLNSDPNVPLPSGTFSVFYRFQFTKPGDGFAIDYDSRQVISIVLTMRTYPQSNLPYPQNVTVKTSATVRNFIR